MKKLTTPTIEVISAVTIGALAIGAIAFSGCTTTKAHANTAHANTTAGHTIPTHYDHHEWIHNTGGFGPKAQSPHVDNSVHAGPGASVRSGLDAPGHRRSATTR